MFNVYFDSGTSNTRAYLLKGYDVIDVIKKNVGSKDSSIAGSNRILLSGLKEAYDELLKSNRIFDCQVNGVYASGMITSPFGIKEVPHLSTPVSLEKLYEGIYTHFEGEYFNRKIHLIRGVKTVPDGFAADRYNISGINNMRGEEIEIFGILSHLPDCWQRRSIAIFLPGSHTHIAYIKQGILDDMLSTFSGELYHAISTSTILSGSVQSADDDMDLEMVSIGYKNLKEYGLNRALYIAHATKIFNAADNMGRKSYLEGVISGGVVTAFEKVINNKWCDLDGIIIAGNTKIARVYDAILRETAMKAEIMMLSAQEKVSFAVQGFIQILKMTNSKSKII